MIFAYESELITAQVGRMPPVGTEPHRVGVVRSSDCAGEATARTKRELIEVALLRHVEQLTDRPTRSSPTPIRPWHGPSSYGR
ncbi:hypothetical protein ACFFV7_32315 [Nonomuraea spiralis]|uniref:Uncharacterized protein n=1 Tax=Nonomuraea spiralis TaxID=46182 RepID=A0ABV5IN21_9ACTN|nr:hypothetical protein [Nonomuraea spiralis]GGT38490.1 hypothetical protein GCM10010176_098170 [Nonomuraea spiralis]